MRVNVTYSVELDEVNQLIEELLLKAEDSVESVGKIFPQIQNSVQSDNEKSAVELIEECRASLMMLDHSLFDCHNILTGYQHTVLQMKGAPYLNTEDNVSENPNVKNR